MVPPLSNAGLVRLLIAAGLLLCAALTGCEPEYRVVNDPWGNYRRLAGSPRMRRDQGPGADLDAGAGLNTGDGWAIRLETYTGGDATGLATRKLYRLQKELHVSDVWMREEPGRVSLYRGHYIEATSQGAQDDLRQTQMLKLDGVRLYQDSDLVPLSATARGAAGQWDLSGYTGLYSLQIAAYTPEIGDDYRQKAELAAKVLREDGADAYYYHGPAVSIVTIGLFHDWEFIKAPNAGGGEVNTYPKAVLELQKQEKYKYNLVNGRTLMVKEAGQGQAHAQPSFLVQAPE